VRRNIDEKNGYENTCRIMSILPLYRAAMKIMAFKKSLKEAMAGKKKGLEKRL